MRRPFLRRLFSNSAWRCTQTTSFTTRCITWSRRGAIRDLQVGSISPSERQLGRSRTTVALSHSMKASNSSFISLRASDTTRASSTDPHLSRECVTHGCLALSRRRSNSCTSRCGSLAYSPARVFARRYTPLLRTPLIQPRHSNCSLSSSIVMPSLENGAPVEPQVSVSDWACQPLLSRMTATACLPPTR